MIVPISYVLKALKNWMEDVGLTPNIKFKTCDSGVRIPEHLKESEVIALNIGREACRNFVMMMIFSVLIQDFPEIYLVLQFQLPK